MTDETEYPDTAGPPREVSEDAAAREAKQMVPAVLDDILHALGRPDDPMQETYRNHYCGIPYGCDTPLWRRVREPNTWCPDPIYVVTDHGREQAAKAMQTTVKQRMRLARPEDMQVAKLGLVPAEEPDAAARETRTLDKQAMAICYDHNLSIDVAVAITNAMLEAHATGKAEGVAEERDKLAQWMILHSFATGHGDTIEDLLSELTWQVAHLRASGGKTVGEYISYADVVRLLREACDREGGQIDFARKHDLSPAHVSDVVRERRDPGQGILAALGLVKVTLYARNSNEAPDDR